jgi:outer membrane protein OmpA-like peptidoglycan-associated protein
MAGYIVSEWNTNSKGTGKSYSFGQALKLTSSTILYAQWKGHKVVTLFGAVGSFKVNSSTLSGSLRNQILRIARTVKAKKYSVITLYGYTASTGLASFNISLSRARAERVAQYLRQRLDALRVKGVTIRSAGEGAIAGESNSSYSRVEVFGV